MGKRNLLILLLINKFRNWKSKGIFGKIFYALFDFPLTFIRDLTIPPCEISKWNRIIFIIMPLFIFSFIVATTQSKNKYNFTFF